MTSISPVWGEKTEYRDYYSTHVLYFTARWEECLLGARWEQPKTSHIRVFYPNSHRLARESTKKFVQPYFAVKFICCRFFCRNSCWFRIKNRQRMQISRNKNWVLDEHERFIRQTIARKIEFEIDVKWFSKLFFTMKTLPKIFFSKL